MHDIRPPSLRALMTATLVLTLVTGCATAPRPVLYPDAKTRSAGEAGIDAAVDRCVQRADAEVGRGDSQQRLLKNVGIATIVGGAAGLAWGLAYGGMTEGLQRGGAGAAAGGVGIFVKNLLTRDEPDEVHNKFVEKCLKKQGFQVLGWR